METKKKAGMGIFLMVVALFWFAQYTFIPFFTPYLTGLGIASSLVGNIVGAYGFVQLLLRIPLGVGADMLRRHKTFISLGLIVVALAGIVLQFSSSPLLFLIARALAGIAASTWVSFTVFFSGFFSAENTNKAMGQIMMFNNGGILAAYLLGGICYEPFGMKSLFLLSTIAALIGFVLIFFVKDTGAVSKNPVKISELALVLKEKRLWNYSLISALSQLICFATAMSFTSNVAKSMGAGGLELGIISAVFILAGLLSSKFITGAAAERIGDKRLSICSFLLMALYCILIPLCPNLWCIYLCQFIGGLGRSTIMTLMMSNSVKYIAPEKKSTAMGIYQSIYSLGMTAGPMLMGLMLEYMEFGPAYFIMAAFSLVGVVWIFLTRFGKKAA